MDLLFVGDVLLVLLLAEHEGPIVVDFTGVVQELQDIHEECSVAGLVFRLLVHDLECFPGDELREFFQRVFELFPGLGAYCLAASELAYALLENEVHVLELCSIEGEAGEDLDKHGVLKRSLEELLNRVCWAVVLLSQLAKQISGVLLLLFVVQPEELT